MNERINKLAEESGMTQYVAADNKYLERFAEMVLQDCLVMANIFEMTVERVGLSNAIKEHFGVSDE